MRSRATERMMTRRRSSPRVIRTGRLHLLPGFHFPPINRVIFPDPYRLRVVGGLILGWASRLDAFSGYPDPAWLPGACRGCDSRDTRGWSPGILSYDLELPSSLQRPRRIGTDLSHDGLNPAHVPLFMGEQPNPWDLLQPQDAMSRHRGAKLRRRWERSGAISLLSPG